MTGGGPSGATKLYSILAYEKAIGSLQYGPGSAIALSVAPLMAILICLLAKFMRPDDRAATRATSASIGNAHRPVLRPVLQLPPRPHLLAVRHDLLAASSSSRGRCGSGHAAIARQAAAQCRKGANAAAWGCGFSCSCPILIFVLFPFYWVIVTSFKSTPQISARSLDLLARSRSPSSSTARCSSGLAVLDLARQLGAGRGASAR